jgi:hypothetical protein
MMLNEGMFAGTQGWALKPEGYRSSSTGDVDQASARPSRQHLSLKLRLLAAQKLPVPIDRDGSYAPKMKPYVKAQLHIDSPYSAGHTRDSDPDAKGDQAYGGEAKDGNVYKRRSATCRTDSPGFSGEEMTWLNMSDVIPELSFLRYVNLLLHFLLPQRPK